MLRQKKKELLISHLSRTWTDELPSLGEKVVIFNTESIYHFFKSKPYRDYVLSCDKTYIDGIGVKIACHLNNVHVDRFHGPDLINRLQRTKKRVIVIGGSGNYFLPINYKYHSIPFSRDILLLAEEISNIINTDRSCQYVLLSLGLPKQELVCSVVVAKLRDHNISVIPCGAAIDFNYGGKKRSGVVWQKLGLEFLPRLIREPRMLPRIMRSLQGLTYTI